MTNKVSTFDEGSQTWTSYYPDLLSVRSKPGVVCHLEHVIVAGGARPTSEDDDTLVAQDDIEVLNWIENSLWRKVSIELPVPMYAFTPIITNDYLLIVDFFPTKFNVVAYKIPITNITLSTDQHHNSDDDTLTKWTELSKVDCWFTAPVPSLSPPVAVGGNYMTDSIATADIKIYNNSNNSWKKIGSLSSDRSGAGVAALYGNIVIIIGGCTEGNIKSNRDSSSVTVVELGQAELLH